MATLPGVGCDSPEGIRRSFALSSFIGKTAYTRFASSCASPLREGRWRAPARAGRGDGSVEVFGLQRHQRGGASLDRKSTRLNSSHVRISYAVFCLKKKKKTTQQNWCVG